MKNQYFGDIRDLFKYDLILRIVQETSSINRFLFIPMLTENEPESKDGNKKDKSKEGNKRDFDSARKKGKPGTKNNKLVEFLKKYKKIDKDKRDFRDIGAYFKSENIKTIIYRGPDEYFERKTADEYFKNLPENSLHKSLVFVDPDIGLQIKNSTEKHLLYCEVKDLYNRMDEDSILMIYQHFPRDRHKYKEYLPEGRSNKLEKEIGDLPIYISDNEIIFFLLTKNDELKNQLERIINRYKKDYPKLIPKTLSAMLK